MKFRYSGTELRSTYRAHVYTREHLRSEYTNELMDRIEGAFGDLGLGWDRSPTSYEWDKIADLINDTK